ncbi:DNA repair protein XRCC2 isoform X1 [Latimeria chalumnae]|uniref:DNA repair protein XRCC2 isoform X1 n=1 Tax=Latimeria chalumnae TaxID=7897 RepID=UPI0003C10790|nr:PREDICTED: DNA repair protein XRCC2 isoform X1 [Latimeria chalumnae]XP_006001717.1 PREDICTED: DNA repair protein XRCC2 isoform X1 [Latimeria chalumnae]|eukprot:XP_006001716.1 PREDICTED: DNA repair protein XRCC2 isoform X1 [Latimeria chalumnae]
MGMFCCASGCNNRYGKVPGVSFYRIPTNPVRRQQWVSAIKREGWQPTRHTRLCSAHFVSGVKSDNPLAPNYIPSIFSYISNSHKRKLESRVDTDKQHSETTKKKGARIGKKMATAALLALCEQGCSVEAITETATQGMMLQPVKTELDISTKPCNIRSIYVKQEDNEHVIAVGIASLPEQHNEFLNKSSTPSCRDIVNGTNGIQSNMADEYDPQHGNHNCDQLKVSSVCLDSSNEKTNTAKGLGDLHATKKSVNVSCLTDENYVTIQQVMMKLRTLQERCRHLEDVIQDLKLDENVIRSNPEMLPFYTGLASFDELSKVYEIISPCITESSTFLLSKFQKLLLTLMKLKLNLKFQDLAYRFRVSKTTAANVFHATLYILYMRLSFLIVWPEREELLKMMPIDFQELFKDRVAAVTDCFELSLERSSRKEYAQSCSNEENHPTLKFLIGITPQGTISFVSKAWGGQVSDEMCTESCGILNNLLPGDVLVSNRGIRCAELKASVDGKPQLVRASIDSSPQLFRLRMHMKNVIGHMRKKYAILQGTLPINLSTVKQGYNVRTLDMIVFICAALTNMTPGVVKLE